MRVLWDDWQLRLSVRAIVADLRVPLLCLYFSDSPDTAKNPNYGPGKIVIVEPCRVSAISRQYTLSLFEKELRVFHASSRIRFHKVYDLFWVSRKRLSATPIGNCAQQQLAIASNGKLAVASV